MSVLATTVGLALGLAVPAAAQQLVQSVQANIGVFVPRGVDSRVPSDVLVNDLDFLAFRIQDFKAVSFGGEWDLDVGDHVEGEVGVGYLQRHVGSVYQTLVNSDGSEIQQTLGLRVVPVTFGVRFLPFGRLGSFQPYVGGGAAVLNWRYSESGQWVDPNYNIFQAVYRSTGTTVGPFWMVGVKAPMGGDIYALTVEVRYQYGTGTLDPTQGFAGSKIDLGGLTTRFGFQVRF